MKKFLLVDYQIDNRVGHIIVSENLSEEEIKRLCYVNEINKMEKEMMDTIKLLRSDNQ